MTEFSRRVYVDAALQYIADMESQIRRTADFLGLSAGAIGGALAEELEERSE